MENARMRKFSLILFLMMGIFFSNDVLAQKKKTLTSYDDVVKIAKEQLATSQQSGKLAEYIIEHKIKGEFIFDITVGDKGKVMTVFAVTSDDDKYKTQNKLKDYLKTLKFDIKTAKGKLYKFQYTFYIE